jgi:DNA mismatch endonuclease (patch repair protein)|tara:strand:- start:49 stop:471 length:423 start_codon:yes stop_codon:yes gene_type:complete
MVDNLTPEKRTEVMKSIISEGTKPELVLRRFLFAEGFRYRKNYKKLPGRPDIVFIKKKIAIFVHGCFWHQHKNCKITNKPRSNTLFWKEKFAKNLERDKRNQKDLREMGWNTIVIWECEILDTNRKTRNLSPILNRLNLN